MLMAMKDKPLQCPICRRNVLAFHAPHDLRASAVILVLYFSTLVAYGLF